MLKNKEQIEKLTLQEKAALTAGSSEWETYEVKGKVGKIFLADGPFGLRKQSGAGDHLGLNASEPATCFPSTATMANSWDPEVPQEVGEALGIEAAALKVNQVLGPALNVKRNPRGGRSFEYFSEDPYLAGKMAASLIRGIQKNDTVATPKHLAVNSQETRRMASNSVVDERTLREIYLTNFEIAVKEGKPKSIMSSYNLINGTYANENKKLLDNILRKEWGFDGYVVTDWGGDNDHTAGIKAGSNLEMPGVGSLAAQEIVEAVKTGKLSENVLDRRVDELLTVINYSSKQKPAKVDWKYQHEIARDAAKRSIVLLKNEDHVLPLTGKEKVALIGDFAKNPRYQGAGSSIINSKHLENLFDTAKDYGINLAGYAQGYDRLGKINEKLVDEAVNLLKHSDLAIVNIGLTESAESEGLDRSNLQLPKNQLDLIKRLSTTGKKVIVVLSGGAAVEMMWQTQVDAIVHEYLGGEAGASAVWEVLTGKYNPSGRLSETYPLQENDIPFNNEFPQSNPNVYYKEGIFVGYRYYTTAGIETQYPFGYGLSYTKFKLDNLQVSQAGITVDVENIGQVKGKETVQLYVGKEDSTIIRAARELKGFKQVELNPGEKKTISIAFDDKTFRFFDVNSHDWQVEKGTYQIMIAKNVNDICCQAEYEISNGIIPQVKETDSYKRYKAADLHSISERDFEELYGKSLPKVKMKPGMDLNYESTLSDLIYSRSWLGRMIAKWLKKKINQSLANGKPNLNFLFNYNMPIRAIFKMTNGLVSQKMAEDLVFLFNGHFWRGSGRLIRDYFANRKNIKNASWYKDGGKV
ncbi:beta-glucosidase [Lactobacillus colini]|uniref:Beta-glucosidase n=1 Tax=Lactobacillus colini TaxID=1819254 RepID=A0ABS4MBA0_9LACO|nr:glycoside hydrolase family 3 C-terminal domain-containing protein [Lactobacillus colini]MBP2056939.1 beta-glucosidase [Lactobacillus colini]